MKREILCPECRVNYRKLFPTNTPYPGEHLKFVDGKSSLSVICDSCTKPIEPGDDCTAFSAWADYGGIPYHKWESEYIDITP